MSALSKYVCRKGPIFHAVQREMDRRQKEALLIKTQQRTPVEKIDAMAGEIASHKTFEDLQFPIKNGIPRIVDIQRATCAHFDITVRDLLSYRRTSGVVLPRHIAYYLSKVHTIHSYPEIGRRFGDRDHTTILHGVRNVEARICVDEKLRAHIAAIEYALGIGKAAA